ncbi:MAG: lysophospholipid acyltransferase family protein [Isosphaeraceae bacterium]|nr:lysophospholipid acyltransferase family protein [Isosphaeraceae bacterium]
MRLGLLNVRKGVMQWLLPPLRLLPPRTALRLVSALGRAEYALNPPMRRRYIAALSRGARHFGVAWDVHSLGGALAGNHLRWRARDLLLDGLSNAEAAPLFHIEGREHLDTALAKGRGVVLLFNHFGAFLMPAHWLIREGYPLRWFTERPRHVSKLVRRSFQTDGPLGQKKLFMSRKDGPAEGGIAIRSALRILRAGMIVQVAGDVRWTGPRTAPARFLGRTYTFTTTWITLAARTGAEVVPTFGIMDRDGTYRLEFLPAFTIPAEVVQTGDFSPWVQSYLHAIEERIRRYPDNSSDYLFWAESNDYAVDATTG